MPHYQLFDPNTEILGQVILDFEQAVGSEHFHPIFEQHGLVNLDPDAWYPAQAWLDVLNAVSVSGSGQSMFDFVSIGIRQLELAAVPPGFEDLPLVDALCAIEDAYRLNYRGSDIGGIVAEVIAENHVRLIIRSFEPDDLWYGNIYGFMRRFAPGNVRFKVAYDPDLPRRDQGGEVTVLHVTWQ